MSPSSVPVPVADRDLVIITAALNGVLPDRSHCAHIPYSPEEIAREAKRAAQAGAAMVHIHGREPDGSPCWRPEVFQDIARRIRQVSDVIINFSTGGIGLPAAERCRHIGAARPDVAALNMGSMNYAIYSPRKKRFYHDHVFQNPFADIITFLRVMKDHGVRPELECFDTGHIRNAVPLLDMGLLRPPLDFSLVLGVLGGAHPTVKTLLHMSEILPAESHWQVIGIGKLQWRLVAAALAMGGNIRVGLEDNFYLPDGSMAHGNAPLVEKAVALALDLGRQPASASQAREILGISPVPAHGSPC